MDYGNTIILQARQDVLSGKNVSLSLFNDFLAAVAQSQGPALASLLTGARDIRLARLGRSVSLCAIVNARSGRCSENCAFCAQSSHFDTSAPVYPFLPQTNILAAAQAMRSVGATRFGIVLSGASPTTRDFGLLLEAVRGVADLGMHADASCGLLEANEFDSLKRAGLSAYHHNLETARSFFPSICSTHNYDQDVAAVKTALDAGLYVCSGGIFGLGESWAQRAELALTLRELGVPSVPVNFLHPIPGTPMAGRAPLDPVEALKIVALLRFLLPDAHLRICGGRQTVFAEKGLAPMETGGSGLMIGDYLTTKGLEAAADVDGLRQLGWEMDRE